MLENVAELAAARHRELFNSILRVLKAAGYVVSWRICNTVHNGLPQNRRRLYIIGCRSDQHM